MVHLEQQIYDSDFPNSTWDKTLTQTLVYTEQGREKKVSIQVAQGLIFPIFTVETNFITTRAR